MATELNAFEEMIAAHLNHYLQKTPRDFPGAPVPAIECRDGSKMSVQAGEYHYCTPRVNEGPWTHVEVMWLGDNTPLHFEVDDSGISGYCDIRLVAREILSRGNAKIGVDSV
jgi:hypothetical protein